MNKTYTWNIGAPLLASLAALVLAASMLAFTGQAQAITTRPADVAEPAAGNIFVGWDGTFITDGKAAVLKRVNQIRKEACDEGVPDPRDPGRKLTSADYVPIKWSSDLEEIAQTRAAEASAALSHTRPNWESCFSVRSAAGISANGENLAWNYSGMLDGIDQWYDEVYDWVDQNGNETGHYTSLINPDITRIGLGAFAPEMGGWTCTAGEFLTGGSSLSENEVGVKGKRRQLIEVRQSEVSELIVTGYTSLKGSAPKRFSAEVEVGVPGFYPGSTEVGMAPLGGLTWKVGDESLASIDAAGKLTPKKCGSVKVSVSSDSLGLSGSMKVKVVPAATAISKVKGKKKAMAVKWKKGASLATGYQIRYSTKKSMKGAKTVTVKGAAKASKTIKKLKRKTTYYVQVRSIAQVGGETYASAWSKKKSVKTK